MVVISIVLMGCATLTLSVDAAVSDRAMYVSLIRLIANPQTFNGRHLRLAGYLDYNGLDRGVGLYVTQLDGRNFIISNSVDLHIEETKAKGYLGEYVILQGTYHAPAGVLAPYTNGYLDHISGLARLMHGDVSK
jgi:hypothetical protein